jgi:transcriptional regulator with XRE-family HTH domain
MRNGPEDFQRFLRDLREAREYRGVSLEQVAEETRINLEYLEALEDGAWERIGAPYLRGYLISYAECVGMVRDKVLRRFEELEYTPAPLARSRPQVEAVAPPSAPSAPLPPRSVRPEEPQPSADPAPAPAVPSLWQVIPLQHKLAGGALLLVLLAVAFWAIVGLLRAVVPGGAGQAFEETLELTRSETEARRSVLQHFDPFDLSIRLRRPAALRVFSRDSLHFAGTLRGDSLLRIRSTAELTLQLERLEDLDLLLDGEPVALPAEAGPADVRVSRRAASVLRRSP